jgi:anthranilate synthase/aminodeoxychorismate synthase-like glutamine amidotransferase
MILLIDNYDSFVHNLARYLAEMGCQTQVVRNDAASVAEIAAWQPEAIIISPGPCTPNEAGISIELVKRLGGQIPILGVCLGHQAICAALGGRVIRAPAPVHGHAAEIYHTGAGLFEGLPSPFLAARYHSLIVEEQSLPAVLKITARTTDGIPMAMRHANLKIWGVQFHPESVLTQFGQRLLANFLNLAGVCCQAPGPGDLVETREAASVSINAGRPLTW